MLDLRIGILTHPASAWDVKSIEKDCLAAFANEDLSVHVRVFSNPQVNVRGLSPFRYLTSALAAQWRAGNLRLGKHFTFLTLRWHVWQVFGLLASLLRLVSADHRHRVGSEAVRAARIAQGHAGMWEQASREPARLYLFLEDDVILSNPGDLVQATHTLLGANSLPPQFICDCSHSYSMAELGIDQKINAGGHQATRLKTFDFPITNTLAANIVSPALLNSTVSALHDGRAGRGLGIDLDLLRLWSQRGFKVVGCMSTNQVFEQQSGFRSQKI